MIPSKSPLVLRARSELSSRPTQRPFERFRAVLNEGSINHRVQYMIEVLMQVRKDKYKGNPILPEGLDLVEEEQITHEIQLEEDLKVEEGLSMYPICHTSIIFKWSAGRYLHVRSKLR